MPYTVKAFMLTSDRARLAFAALLAVAALGCSEQPATPTSPPSFALGDPRGAQCDFVPVDCGVTTVGPSGGTALSDSTFAGAQFPPGALDQTIEVIIQRIVDKPCLPTDLLQFDGCFRFETEPHVDHFLLPVTIGVCFDDNGALPHEQEDELLIHKFELDDPDSVVTATDNVFVGFLACSDFQSALRNGGTLGHYASNAWHGLLRFAMLEPTPAWAIHKGLGSTIGSFSQGGWALPALMASHDGDGQSAAVGHATAIAPSVALTDSAGAPIEGMTIHFAVGSGGGSITGAEAVTDANGIARVGSWTLGSLGPNTLIADARGPVGAPITFTATGTPSGWGSPTIDGHLAPGEWDNALTWDFTARVSGGPVTGRLLILNDGTNLYVAVALPGVLRRPLGLRLDFDNDGGGQTALNNDAIVFDPADGFADLHLVRRCLNSGQASCGDADATNGSGAFGTDPGFSVWELSHPLSSGEGGDIAVGAGDPLGLFLSLVNGNGAQGNSQWPGFRNYLAITVATGP